MPVDDVDLHGGDSRPAILAERADQRQARAAEPLLAEGGELWRAARERSPVHLGLAQRVGLARCGAVARASGEPRGTRARPKQLGPAFFLTQRPRQYSDPKQVRELLDASEKQEVRRRGAERKQVERRLADVDADFAKNLSLLKWDVLDEEEFRKANRGAVGRAREAHGASHGAHRMARAAARAPGGGRHALHARALVPEDVQAPDTRRAKALLQTILASAQVYRDGRIELEFR